MAQYICPKKLNALVAEAQRTGQVSDELATAIMMIARGRIAKLLRYRDIDDYVQAAATHVLEKLNNIDPTKNAFSYVTTSCWHTFLGMQRKEMKEQARLLRLAERLEREA